jgi:hypothetical protein
VLESDPAKEGAAAAHRDAGHQLEGILEPVQGKLVQDRVGEGITASLGGGQGHDTGAGHGDLIDHIGPGDGLERNLGAVPPMIQDHEAPGGEIGDVLDLEGVGSERYVTKREGV